jgi:hypothetical protein
MMAACSGHETGLAVFPTPAPGGAWPSQPGCDRFIGHQDRETAALAERRIILRPISSTLTLTRNVVPSGRIKFGGHGGCPGSGGERLPLHG